jgi:hypothetical protein
MNGPGSAKPGQATPTEERLLGSRASRSRLTTNWSIAALELLGDEKRSPQARPARLPGWLSCDLSAVVSNSTRSIDPFRPVFVAAAAVLVATAIAHADSPDDQFLGLLSKDGLNVGPPDQMIAIAHERCDDDGLSRSGVFLLRVGEQPSPFMVAITKIYTQLESRGLTTAQVGQFMWDAITVYCPDKKDR